MTHLELDPQTPGYTACGANEPEGERTTDPKKVDCPDCKAKVKSPTPPASPTPKAPK